jgi:hypothetical protein
MKAHPNTAERSDASSDHGLVLHTEEQAAKFYGLQPKTMANWRHRGFGPPFIKVGGRIGYLERDLIEFLESRRFSSTTDYEVRGMKRKAKASKSESTTTSDGMAENEKQ